MLETTKLRRQEHSESRDRKGAYFDNLSYPTDSDLHPRTSDHNCSTQAPSHRKTAVDPFDIRRWHRAVVQDSVPGRIELESTPSSSAQLETYPSWPFEHPDRTDHVERTKRLLQSYTRAMDRLRLEAGELRQNNKQQEMRDDEEEFMGM